MQCSFTIAYFVMFEFVYIMFTIHIVGQKACIPIPNVLVYSTLLCGKKYNIENYKIKMAKECSTLSL